MAALINCEVMPVADEWPDLEHNLGLSLIAKDIEDKKEKVTSGVSSKKSQKVSQQNSAYRKKWERVNVDFKYSSPESKFQYRQYNNGENATQMENKENTYGQQHHRGQEGYQRRRNFISDFKSGGGSSGACESCCCQDDSDAKLARRNVDEVCANCGAGFTGANTAHNSAGRGRGRHGGRFVDSEGGERPSGYRGPNRGPYNNQNQRYQGSRGGGGRRGGGYSATQTRHGARGFGPHHPRFGQAVGGAAASTDPYLLGTNYPTGIPLLMTFGHHGTPLPGSVGTSGASTSLKGGVAQSTVASTLSAMAKGGLLTTVSAGSLYGNQIVFLPTSSSSGSSATGCLASNSGASDISTVKPAISQAEATLLGQIEYYFSENNLCRDTYLRSRMDAGGWVSLLTIAEFKRIAQLVLDIHLIAEIVSKSSQLEVDRQGLRVRLRDRPTRWLLLPVRSTGISNDGSVNLNPDAPEFVPQFESMDELADDSAFKPTSTASSSIAGSATRPLTTQERHKMALQAKFTAKMKGRQRLPSSMMSEDDVDDTMLSYLVVISPESPDSPDTSEPGSLADSKKGGHKTFAAISRTLLDKHPSGDRQPCFLTRDAVVCRRRSKINSDLEEMIKLGLEEYEVEFRNKNSSVRGVRSRASSTSDSKVNVISREEFEVLSQSLSESHLGGQDKRSAVGGASGNRRQATQPPPAPPLPKVISSQPAPDNVLGSFGPLCPTLIGIPAPGNSLYPPGTYMYFPPVAAGQPAHVTLVPQVPLSVSVCEAHRPGEESLAPPSTATGTAAPSTCHSAAETPTYDSDEPQPLRSILRLRHDKMQAMAAAHNQQDENVSSRPIVGFFPAGSDRYSSGGRTRRQRLYSEGENMQLETHVGFAFDTRSNGSRSRTMSASSDTDLTCRDGGASNFGLKTHKTHAILKSHGFTFQGYTKFRIYALKDREIHGVGLSQEMNTLYRFWSFFLRENFNKSMFQEFRSLAIDDAENNARYGLECLFRFYSYGLELRLRRSLLHQFQEDTLTDFHTFGHKYGLEKFWAFLHYSGRRVELDPRLAELLQRFRTLEDIRADFIPPDGFFIDRTRPRHSSDRSQLSQTDSGGPLSSSDQPAK